MASIIRYYVSDIHLKYIDFTHEKSPLSVKKGSH